MTEGENILEQESRMHWCRCAEASPTYPTCRAELHLPGCPFVEAARAWALTELLDIWLRIRDHGSAAEIEVLTTVLDRLANWDRRAHLAGSAGADRAGG